MIAACPKCSARYRIAKERVRPEGVRLRCSRCEAVFRVRSPELAVQPEAGMAEERPAAAPPEQRPAVQAGFSEAPSGLSEAPRMPQAPALVQAAPTHAGPRIGQPPAFETEEENALDRERLVLVADPVTDEGKATAAALAAWGLQPILVHDGVEAILAIQRKLPRAVVIDAALPKMYGFQICELLKRNESLRHIQVILVGAIHDRSRYRRNPTEIYGADAYLERPQLPDALWPMLRGFGLPLAGGSPQPAATPPRSETAPLHREHPRTRSSPPAFSADSSAAVASGPPAPAAPAQRPAPQIAPFPPPAPAAPPPAAPVSAPPESGGSAAIDPMLDAEVAKAERLARIVVSDIILYNQEKFDAAVQAGDVVAAMGADMEEGRSLFAQRIDSRVRESRDFLIDELLRVAEMRRLQ